MRPGTRKSSMMMDANIFHYQKAQISVFPEGKLIFSAIPLMLYWVIFTGIQYYKMLPNKS
jgi:hypothetical protein